MAKKKVLRKKRVKAQKKPEPLPKSVQALLRYLGGSDAKISSSARQPAMVAQQFPQVPQQQQPQWVGSSSHRDQTSRHARPYRHFQHSLWPETQNHSVATIHAIHAIQSTECQRRQDEHHQHFRFEGAAERQSAAQEQAPPTVGQKHGQLST